MAHNVRVRREPDRTPSRSSLVAPSFVPETFYFCRRARVNNELAMTSIRCS
jgi:hypothetical protein